MPRFVDFATITLCAGKGGGGIVSFCRERYRPFGGPDGGDGGRGGHVILVLDTSVDSLEHLSHQRRYAAGDGAKGGSSQKNGRNGADCRIALPAGTIVRTHDPHRPHVLREGRPIPGTHIVYSEHTIPVHARALAEMDNIDNGHIFHRPHAPNDSDDPTVLCEITTENPSYTLIQGGRGGFGNTKFKTAHNRAPKFAQPGGDSECCTVDLELRIIADIGLVGMPNAGKSSLLRALSNATPEVADYPFTTITPKLGIVEPSPITLPTLAVVDIPGIIEGASHGHGLGHRFLQHLAHVRTIVFVLSLVELDTLNATHQLRLLQDELSAYNPNLLQKAALIAANKIDCPTAARQYEELVHADSTPSLPIVTCSATEMIGIDTLTDALYQT